MKVDAVAERIIQKWLRKGNMARAMRDVLPRSGLSFRQRDEVARIVHNVVRWKKLYDYALGHPGKPEEYISFVRSKKLEEFALRAYKDGRLDIFYSSSPEVARIFHTYPDFAERVNREPETHLSVNISKVSRDEVIRELYEEGTKARVCRPDSCVLTEPHGRYSRVIKNGLAIVQDASSQIISKMVASLGNRIVDYCAGSGGKSFTIKFFNPRAEVYVHDVSSAKIESLFRRAKVLNLDFHRFSGGSGEVVLVDAPCSGLGAAARNPEVKYRNDLDYFPSLQMEILEKASRYVEGDGYLVYVVCTFNPDETFNIIEKFMVKHQEFDEVPVDGPEFRTARKGAYVFAGDVMYISVLHRVL